MGCAFASCSNENVVRHGMCPEHAGVCPSCELVFEDETSEADGPSLNDLSMCDHVVCTYCISMMRHEGSADCPVCWTIWDEFIREFVEAYTVDDEVHQDGRSACAA